MINFDDFKNAYANATGVILFDEEGQLLDFYRDNNTIEMPGCGVWHLNPIPLTAVNNPFCGIATVDITVLSHPTIWENTRDLMNEYASIINGTSQQYVKDGTTYSISINAQTCSVGNRILDVGIGYGEVYEIRQQLSYIIVESGVSAYETTLTIDGLQIPFLSLLENKIHTTSNIPSALGVMNTASEAEMYGIDFVVPYMKDDGGSLVRDVIDRATGNEAHCVVVEIAGEKHCHIMQFTHVSANVQPPQNVGMNVSMMELDPTAAKYNGMWEKETITGPFATVNLQSGEENAESFVVFWGDGVADTYKNDDTPYHVYCDNQEQHDVIIFNKPSQYYLPLTVGKDYYGKPLFFRFNSSKRKISITELKDTFAVDNVVFGNRYDSTEEEKMARLMVAEYDGKKRLYFVYGVYRYYVDSKDDGGDYYISDGKSVQCLVDTISFIEGNADKFLFTSVWD